MDNLDVLPVKPVTDQNLAKMPFHENLPDINKGAMVLMISPVRTGKSTIINNLLLNPNFYRDRFDIVYIISNTIHNDDTSRFLKEQFKETVWDTYSDDIIQNIINYQQTFSKKDMPKIAIILDDFVGTVHKKSMIFFLASRFRHYNIGLLLFASQVLKGVPPIVRANATNVIMGSPNHNGAELEKLAEEYGSMFKGKDNFLRIYNQAAEQRYDFLYLKLDQNPPEAYRKFNQLLYRGEANGEKLEDVKFE